MKRVVILALLVLPVVFAASEPQFIRPYSSGSYEAVKADMPLYVQWYASQMGPNVHIPYRAQTTFPEASGQCPAKCLAKHTACLEEGNPYNFCSSAYYGCTQECNIFGKSPCADGCLSSYSTCVKAQPQNTCFDRFGKCQQLCAPQVQAPAPTGKSCRENCEASYKGCLNAGGSITICSLQAFNPCMTKCPQETYATTTAVKIKPAPAMQACAQSCGASCGVLYEQCKAAGKPNCESEALSCLRTCSGGLQGPTGRSISTW